MDLSAKPNAEAIVRFNGTEYSCVIKSLGLRKQFALRKLLKEISQDEEDVEKVVDQMWEIIQLCYEKFPLSKEQLGELSLEQLEEVMKTAVTYTLPSPKQLDDLEKKSKTA